MTLQNSGDVLGIRPTSRMKKPVSPVVIGIVAVVAVGLVVFLFAKGVSGPAPTAQNLPDYAKMTPEQIAKEKSASMNAERDNARPK